METDTTFTIEITNNLFSGELEVNNEPIKSPRVAYKMPASELVTISRRGSTVSVTIPNGTPSDKQVYEGICVCISRNITFQVTPTASMNITLQTGYISEDLPDAPRGVRCGDGF